MNASMTGLRMDHSIKFMSNFYNQSQIVLTQRIASICIDDQIQQSVKCHPDSQVDIKSSQINMQTQHLLRRAGDQNKFQLYSIVFVCFKWMIVSLTVFLPSYLFITPTFTCGSELRVLEVDACGRIAQCQIDNPYTITAHAHLYCEDRFVRDSIISSEFAGSVTGLILLSILADRLGRKVIIVTTLYFTGLGAMLLTIGSHYIFLPLMYIGLILMGFGGYSLSMVSYSYLSEINKDSWRQKSLIMTYSFWAIGEIMLYPIITWIQDWTYICFFVFVIPIIILLIMSNWIVQPPQFLFVQKRYDECLVSLNTIAKFNGKSPIESLGDLPDNNEAEAQKITDTFTKPKFLIPLLVLSFAQVCNNGLYYTTQYSINEMGRSFQFNMLIIGCLELVSCLITNFYCQRMHRKWWILIFMIVSGTIGLLIQLTDQSSWIEIGMIGMSRLFNTFGFALFSLITTESFPTSIRSTGCGISEAMSNLGNMIAPFLVTISGDLHVKAVFIGGIICIAGGISMLLVKETKVKKVKTDQSLLEKDGLTQQNLEGTIKKSVTDPIQ